MELALTRAMLWRTAVDLTETGLRSLADLVAMVDLHLRPERHPVVFEGVMGGQCCASSAATPSARTSTKRFGGSP